MSVISWTEIGNFHNVRKYASEHPEILNNNLVVTYQAKVKLHGENHAIQVYDSTVVTQSRKVVLTPSSDNKGFAKWADEFKTTLIDKVRGYILYGEWCGPGIQDGVAINKINNKIFAVFAARSLLSSNKFIIDPSELTDLVKDINTSIYTIGWYSPAAFLNSNNEVSPMSWHIDFSSSEEELSHCLESINTSVLEVEENDPWVKSKFDVQGTGEGLVFYPVSTEHLGYSNFENLAFKAKGEKHRVLKTKEPAQLNAQVTANAQQFAELVLTDARLEQGVRVIANGDLIFDSKLTGKFIAWMLQDVQKETSAELEASNLDWKQVQKVIAEKSRVWYLGKSKR